MNELEQIHQLARVEAELLLAREELDVSAAALIEKPIEELIEISIRRQAILDLIHRAADESRRIADDLLNSACCQARDAVFNRKYALAGLKRYNESAAAYKKAIQIDPQNPLDVYSLGVIEEEQGRQRAESSPPFHYRSTADETPRKAFGLTDQRSFGGTTMAAPTRTDMELSDRKHPD